MTLAEEAQKRAGRRYFAAKQAATLFAWATTVVTIGLIVTVLLLVADTARTIESCVTPGQPCYERSLENQRQSTEQSRDIIVLAAACARQGMNDTEAEIEACVQAGLDAAAGDR